MTRTFHKYKIICSPVITIQSECSSNKYGIFLGLENAYALIRWKLSMTAYFFCVEIKKIESLVESGNPKPVAFLKQTVDIEVRWKPIFVGIANYALFTKNQFV